MPFLVIEDEALGPIDVVFPGAAGIGLEPNTIGYLVGQLLGLWCRADLRTSRFDQEPQLGYNPDEFCKDTWQEILHTRFLA